MEKYVREKKIIGHASPKSIDKLEVLFEKAKNAVCKIFYFGTIGTGFFFQQNISNIEYNNRYFLMTNNHVLDADSINNNVEIRIEYKKKNKTIPLNNRIKYTNVKLDFTIIEILPNDLIFSEINYFFKIDKNIMNNNESKYLEQDICIFQHPNGGDLSYDPGVIQSINDYEIVFYVSTDYGSSGSPIILLNNSKIIGIHNKRYNEYCNRGIFMKHILSDIHRNYNNNMFIMPQNRNYNNNNIFIPQNKNNIYNNKFMMHHDENDINNNMFKITQNKNELTDISGKINNNKKRIRHKKNIFFKSKIIKLKKCVKK